MAHREDNPWYPTMRIFRQNEHMAWGPVFERMAAALRELVPDRIRTASVAVSIAPGELLDKITILEIKAARISDPDKLRNVRAELAVLLEARERAIFERDELALLIGELRATNEALWDIEDEIRGCERDGEFGAEFVELARSVYKNNDRRAELKRNINMLLGSQTIEEKSYSTTGAGHSPRSSAL